MRTTPQNYILQLGLSLVMSARIKSYCETLLDCATNIAQLFGRIAKLLRRIAKLFGRIAKLFLRN